MAASICHAWGLKSLIDILYTPIYSKSPGERSDVLRGPGDQKHGQIFLGELNVCNEESIIIGGELFLPRGISIPKISYTFGRDPFVFKKNPSKIRKNPFILTASRTLFPMSAVPLDFYVEIISQISLRGSHVCSRGFTCDAFCTGEIYNLSGK